MEIWRFWRGDKIVIGQDVNLLGKHVDTFSPMTYRAMCGRSIEWIKEVVSWVWERTRKQVLPIIQVADVPRGLTIKEIKHASEAAITAEGSSGVIIFSTAHLKKRKLREISKVERVSI